MTEYSWGLRHRGFCSTPNALYLTQHLEQNRGSVNICWIDEWMANSRTKPHSLASPGYQSETQGCNTNHPVLKGISLSPTSLSTQVSSFLQVSWRKDHNILRNQCRHKGKTLTMGVIPTGIQTPVSVFPCCVTLSKLLYISGSQFSCVWGRGGGKKIILCRFLQQLNEIT